jgi:hypothetical protein
LIQSAEKLVASIAFKSLLATLKAPFYNGKLLQVGQDFFWQATKLKWLQYHIENLYCIELKRILPTTFQY